MNDTSDSREELLDQTRQQLQLVSDRMEGSSLSQIRKAIRANRFNRFVPDWARPVAFPVAILTLFGSAIFIIAMLIKHTSVPMPWEFNNATWYYWNFILVGQVVVTGLLYAYEEKQFGKLPGIPRGSLYSILILSAILPILILSLVATSVIFARLQIRKSQSGVWLQSLGGWNRTTICIGAVEIVLFWLAIMLLGKVQYPGTISVVTATAVVSFYDQIFGWVNSDLLYLLVVGLAVLGLIQTLMAAVGIICEATIDEDAIDVTPLLGSLAPLIVISPLCLYLGVTYFQVHKVHELWLLIFQVLCGFWLLLVIVGAVYLTRRWEVVHQPLLIMVMGYLLMLPFFFDLAFRPQNNTAEALPPPQELRGRLYDMKKHNGHSPRAIDILRDL
ncbi:hypothetical protein [Rubinisphaera italica]|uniref:Uncharacterized protein n=1 Tax=Rubinisphaera italica TaxID=2527969 RepID=A0A5C5XKV6_9PLAN|nr:hypothetical protein [Rubinisphaera italica]TWT63023.1 hypothetical protein Pan54_37740 [Rubinisphaera italica]